MDIFDVITLFGGLAMFLFGMRLMGDSLKEASSGTLKRAVERVTNNPVTAFLLGLGITAIIQSSTATIVITAGLVGAGVLSLHQSLGIIIGANVGTTVTGQIIRLLDVDASGTRWLEFLRPSTLAPLALILGVTILMTKKIRNSDVIGGIMAGFGILFSGLLNMTSAVDALSQTGMFETVFTNLSKNPFLGYLAGTAVSFTLQSSSAAVGILQALSVSDALSFSSVYAVILGIYLGDCVTTAIVCAIGSSADSKRVGIIHILFNLSETVLIFVGVMILHAVWGFGSFWSDPIHSGGIANVNTFFKLSTAITLFPFLGTLEQISRKIVKDEKVTPWKYQALADAMNPAFFATPALAFRSCNDALRTMLSLSIASINKAMEMLKTYDLETYEAILEDEKSIDQLADCTGHYLVQLSPHLVTDSNARIFDEYSTAVTEFERLGDHAMNIADYAKALKDGGNELSEDCKKELEILEELIRKVLLLTKKAFEDKDLRAAQEVEPHEEVVDALGPELKELHMERLRAGKCSVYAGAIFLDLLIDLERVSDCCSNVAIAMVSRVKGTTVHAHDYAENLHSGADSWYNAEYQRVYDDYFEKLSQVTGVKL